MGFVRLHIRLQNPDEPERAEPFEALVDTGALVSVVPADVLEKIGVVARWSQRFTLANGTRVERQMSTVRAEYNGRVTEVPVAFDEPGDASVIGVTTLELLGLEVDPVRQEIRLTDLLLL
ncbi:MAG: aspartyl protease family protein [Acidobacteria bacterium]|nr:aspartyl protease family protein [Acidobacteriota bacterium]